MTFQTFLISGISGSLGLGLALAIVTSTEAQSPKGYSRNIPGEDTRSPEVEQIRAKRARIAAEHKTERAAAEEVADAAKKAVAEADAAEAEYRKAIESNQKEPGTVSDVEVERLRRVYSDSLVSATSKQVKSLYVEVDQLREQVKDLRTVKIRPVQSGSHDPRP